MTAAPTGGELTHQTNFMSRTRAEKAPQDDLHTHTLCWCIPADLPSDEAAACIALVRDTCVPNAIHLLDTRHFEHEGGRPGHARASNCRSPVAPPTQAPM